MEAPRRISELNGIAGCMSTDSDLWVTCRFERLHLINLLTIQQRMSDLERDIEDAIKYEGCRSGGQEECPLPEKSSETLLVELQGTVKAYDKAILSLAAIRKIESPDQHIVKCLKECGESQLYSTLVTALRRIPTQRDATSHLISIATDSRSWFHRYIGKHEHLSRIFQEKQDKGDRKFFSKFSETKLKNTEFGIVAVCLCVVQLLPVLALTLVSSKAVRLAVIIILIVLVSLLNALFANTVRATNFGAIAAYSAIVVVFVSQSN